MENANPGDYDIILMDIQMPVMNGYEATKRIRMLENPHLASIPIIAMTANAFDEDKKKAFHAGMNDFVSKPIDVENLLSVISSITEACG
jgi:CheY-like chemotaxis protein